jgi:hypothetical protein
MTRMKATIVMLVGLVLVVVEGMYEFNFETFSPGYFTQCV